MLTRPSPDLNVLAPPPMTWSPGHTEANLEQLYGWAQRVAVDAVDWYLTEKQGKARWSRGLRAGTAVLTALGGAVPIAALSAGRPALGNWGFVLLALAAGCLGYDRFFGYSSAWLRYVSTATVLRGQLNDFQLRWTADVARLGGSQPSDDETRQFIELIREFTATVHETVRTETESWLTEFHTRLNEMDTQLSKGRPGRTTDSVAT